MGKKNTNITFSLHKYVHATALPQLQWGHWGRCHSQLQQLPCHWGHAGSDRLRRGQHSNTPRNAALARRHR